MRTQLAARLAAAAALSLGALGLGALAPASACACGGVVSPGNAAAVQDEVALAGWDGRRETIVMRLGLEAESDRAALIVPTPSPARVSAGTAQTFAELARLTAPEIVTERRWFDTDDFRDGATAAAPGGGAPTVLEQVRLGPIEATTLAGGTLDGLRAWLAANGYEMRPEVVATLDPYLKENWSFVAVRLTGEGTTLRGELDPIRLSFDSERFVYPMRMSSAARDPQSVRLYLLGEHRMRRSDVDAEKQYNNVEFAGRIGDSTDPQLRELAADGRDYLTEITVGIHQPAAITSDFTFTAAPSDDGYRKRITLVDHVEIAGFPAGTVILGAASLAAVVVLIAVVRVVRKPS
ncbi:DUF2330 domain-containing protein [Nocardia bovistercoris]|uniref:DUF2330 domain-containing protein n=1 Tax=Nocardia bovistercoris TaxID=2785916 RepID=A0A931IFM1_9NOCA|nr:DUF2330 domain-containing protein [Nocardia bovistercoris]MBH0780639.1 DUF2330 domain-containing protein [Nocardia bovistercoris]